MSLIHLPVISAVLVPLVLAVSVEAGGSDVGFLSRGGWPKSHQAVCCLRARYPSQAGVAP